MTGIDVITKLENVILPEIDTGSHRQELRAALLDRYALMQTRAIRKTPFIWLKNPLRTMLVTSAAWVLIILIVAIAVLIPLRQSEATAAMVINTVMNNTEIRNALAGDEAATVTVNDIGKHQFEAVVAGMGSSIIIVRVETKENAVNITDITDITLLGSLYEANEQLSAAEKEKALDLAEADRTFIGLQKSGAIITETSAINCLVSSRSPETGVTVQTREKWAVIQLQFQNESRPFFIDLQGGRVITRNPGVIPK
jgi:hypothetical protein